MIVPNSIYINQEKLPDFVEVANQEEIIQMQYSKLENAKAVEVTELIKTYKNEGLYYKTDHHMTSKGAYILYIAYCKQAGITPEPIRNFEGVVVSQEFLGTFDSKAQIIGQEADTITAYLNKANTDLKEVIYDTETTKSIFNGEYLQTKDKYSYFLNGNNSKVVVKTKIENGQKLLIIKDSYAHNVVPFLCSNYEEIHVLDPRYFHMSISEYAIREAITEVLVLYNYANLITDIGTRGINQSCSLLVTKNRR